MQIAKRSYDYACFLASRFRVLNALAENIKWTIAMATSLWLFPLRNEKTWRAANSLFIITNWNCLPVVCLWWCFLFWIANSTVRKSGSCLSRTSQSCHAPTVHWRTRHYYTRRSRRIYPVHRPAVDDHDEQTVDQESQQSLTAGELLFRFSLNRCTWLNWLDAVDGSSVGNMGLFFHGYRSWMEFSQHPIVKSDVGFWNVFIRFPMDM